LRRASNQRRESRRTSPQAVGVTGRQPTTRLSVVTVLLALTGALFIGISDFLGGAASLRASPLTVSAVLQLAGLLTLAPIAAALGASALTAGDLGLGAMSGLVTSVAFLGFFTAMAHGRIGVVLPVSAAVAALLPAITGFANGNRLSALALGGVACALVAIPLVAYEPEKGGEEARQGAPIRWSPLRQVLVSAACGAGFGIYFICIGGTSVDSGLWPTVANLVVAVAVTIPVAARGGLLPRPASAPRLALLGGLALGVADSTLTTALQRGPLTIASVLGNLYPLVTIALGVVVLKERVHHWHAVGIVLAVAGVSLIAAG
jgi:drug/metabolite transporter (DMT)-like permease